MINLIYICLQLHLPLKLDHVNDYLLLLVLFHFPSNTNSFMTPTKKEKN